jgi:two-component system response regulator MtrA
VSRIIVVDDDRVFRGLLQTVLEMEGYEAIVEASPSLVAGLAAELQPDLVLMDVHVAGGDTLEVLRGLKADVAMQGVPVLMTSGADHRTECLEAGADDFLLKPFRPSELLAAIAGLVRQGGTDEQTGQGEAQPSVAAC